MKQLASLVSVPLRAAYRLLHPRPVVIVTAGTPERGNAMAASWVTPVSFSPPMVAVAIAPERFTHGLVRETREFALNVPGRDMIDCVNYAGTVSGREEDKIEGLKRMGAEVARGRKIRAPVILNCLAVLECVLESEVEAGDHTLFIGRVVECYADPRVFREGMYIEGTSPLMHVGLDVYSEAGTRVRARPYSHE